MPRTGRRDRWPTRRDESVGRVRIWRAFGLKPHLVDTFKLSPDPLFVDKVRDIVGLYINPPDAALVLCVDEKTQIQALDRTSPVLPLRPGLPERRTHDYLRGGTTNLYAALDVASGHVIADMSERHRATEFRRFLNLINRSVPEALDVHLVVDNVSTHKTPEIHRWLLRHPRFHLHFTPTYSSWMNLVERWFAELTTKWLKRGTHRSTKELETSITTWIDQWNEEPTPFVWHKSADEILEHELGRIQAGAELVRVARPDNRSSDRLIRQDPCNGESHEAHADLFGNGEEPIDGVELPVVPIAALIHPAGVAEGETTPFRRRIVATVLPGQEATGDGVVGDDPDALLTAEREHLTLYLAEQQVVARLHRVEPGQPERLAAPDGADQLVGEEIRTPDVADLALMDEIVERAERLVDRGLCIEPMQLIEIDVVGLQATQGRVNGVEDVPSRVAAVER